MYEKPALRACQVKKVPSTSKTLWGYVMSAERLAAAEEYPDEEAEEEGGVVDVSEKRRLLSRNPLSVLVR